GGGTNGVGTNAPVGTSLRPGVRKISFRKVNFDSILGVSGGSSFTNTWTDRFLTNMWSDRFVTVSVTPTQFLQRITTEPDLLFIADDLDVTMPRPFPVFLAR